MDVVTLGAALSIMKKMPDTAASSAAAASTSASEAAESARQAASYNQDILFDDIPDTTQEYVFSNGILTGITHKRNDVTVRTDTYTYEPDTITEERILASTGDTLIKVTNLESLETTITFTEGS